MLKSAWAANRYSGRHSRPKLRVGKFANTKVTLTPGQTFTLDNKEESGDETRVFLPHPGIWNRLRPATAC